MKIILLFLFLFSTIKIRKLLVKKLKQTKKDNVTPILKRTSLASHSKMHPPQNPLCHIPVNSGSYPSLLLYLLHRHPFSDQHLDISLCSHAQGL